MQIGTAIIGDIVKFNSLAIKTHSSLSKYPNYTIAEISSNKKIIHFTDKSIWKTGVHIKWLTRVKKNKDFNRFDMIASSIKEINPLEESKRIAEELERDNG